MLIRDEGYVKFRQERRPGPPLPERSWKGLEAARAVLYRAGLVGMYQDGIGFGNVSWLEAPETDGFRPFIISGTQTGNLAQLDGRFYVRVLSVNAPDNSLRCEGPVDASSESMTHAAVYAADPSITCVLHVHHWQHWQRLLHRIPTTDAAVAYGTPDMAMEVGRLFRESDLAQVGLFAMAGHEEGLVSFGRNPAEALDRLRAWAVLS
jgi:ribulose-5-phosphate 4-epimerase/fuculose-1-phosphate aldolase